MEADPCSVCGGTEIKLSDDGHYYCIECNTQNTNVIETILEEKALGDGTFAQSTKRKIVQLKKDGVEMSGEWYRWHAFNFIISGLANDLVTLGAKPTFKIKLLWIWTRYIKKYQNKAELGMNKTSEDDNNYTALNSFMVEEDGNSNPQEEDSNVQEEDPDDDTAKRRKKCDITDGSRRDIKFLSKGLVIAMLYVALNLDESDIQLSHIYRFLQEKHFDICHLNRFVPEDINVKKIPQWTNFLRSKLCTQHQVRALAMSLFRKLDLGTPKVPNLRKMIDNFLAELCLPNDMKPFIYSLMHYRKCSFLDIDNKSKKHLIRMPDYEASVMTYILVAIKICFGLDCDYEIKLSHIIEKINLDEDLSKSYRIGQYSEPSDRLFSFREWCSYVNFRKVMLSKHNLRIAEKNCLDVDDYVYLEHMEERPKNNEILSDKISMDIISKIPQERNIGVIPKKLFIPTLTPMSEYTDIIIEYCQDADIKLKLAEDFKRYSLKYACENLELLDSNAENIVKGVSNDKKSECKVILGTIVTKKAKAKMVYVKNCDNKNWLLTKPPTIEHVICADDVENESIDKDSDHGYESEITSKERDNVDTNMDRSLTDHDILDRNVQDSGGGKDEHRQEIIQAENNTEQEIIQEEHNFRQEKNYEKSMQENSDENRHDSHPNIITKNAKDNIDVQEKYRKEIFQESNLSDTDENINCKNILEKNMESNNNTKANYRQTSIQKCKSFENSLQEQDCVSNLEKNFGDHSPIKESVNDHSDAEEECRQQMIQEDNYTVNKSKEKDVDSNLTDENMVEPNHKEERRQLIIEEDNVENNIFDDTFEDLTHKEECEQNNVDNIRLNEDGNDDHDQIQNNNIPDEDFDRRSDISDALFPTFNPDTFDRDRTIKELVLHACKNYKIPVPTEYKTREPRKRKDPLPGNITQRSKRTKYEGKTSVKQLLSGYYNYVETDFVSRVQREMSLAVYNAELQNENLQQNCDLSNSNLGISVVESNSITENGIESHMAGSETSSTYGPINEDLNITNRTDKNTETGDIDTRLEETLFEDDDEMQLEDLIPRGDPHFDEKMYETDQLYLKVKNENMSFDMPDDAEINEILLKKIEEYKCSTEFARLKAEPKKDTVKNKEESDSEDEIPLNVLKEEISLIEEMYQQEEKYERLIKKENIPEYKYWIRHYDRDFMLRSTDWHTKFDEELKENTPTSFCFVIQECASILNCTCFYLYKNMQNFEEYLIIKAENRRSNIQDGNSKLLEVYDESID